MSNFMDIIKDRRSIRKYENKEIPENVLNDVLESVRMSPSWTNSQCWEIILIKDATIKKDIYEILDEYKNPAKKAILDAPITIALCGKKGISGYYKKKKCTKFGDWLMFDLGIASQNICLTAHNYGLGTVVVGLYNHSKMEKILNIPEEYEVPVLIPLGYPAKISKAPKRKEINEFVHIDKF